MPTPNAELEAFKQQVVKVALKAAEDHDWCDVVTRLLDKKLGLKAYLPPPPVEYVVQSKQRADGEWEDDWEYREVDYQKGWALKEAQDTFAENRAARNQRNVQKPTLYMNVNVSSEEELKNLEANFRAQVKQAKDALTAAVETPVWPKYRLIRRGGGERMQVLDKE